MTDHWSSWKLPCVAQNRNNGLSVGGRVYLGHKRSYLSFYPALPQCHTVLVDITIPPHPLGTSNAPPNPCLHTHDFKKTKPSPAPFLPCKCPHTHQAITYPCPHTHHAFTYPLPHTQKNFNPTMPSRSPCMYPACLCRVYPCLNTHHNFTYLTNPPCLHILY